MLGCDFKMQIFLYPLPSVRAVKCCIYYNWPDLQTHCASVLLGLIQSLSPTWFSLLFDGWKMDTEMVPGSPVAGLEGIYLGLGCTETIGR